MASRTAAAARGVSAAELEKFRVLQKQWWNPQGPLRSLHLFNPVRVQYISKVLQQYGKTTGIPAGGDGTAVPAAVLTSAVSILDVGCGGGILSESLARLGATVTGIDMCDESVQVAEARRVEAGRRARDNHWSERLTYKTASLFDLVAATEAAKPLPSEYDAVIASEVIEHVADARGFLSALCQATKPGGLLVLSTMDKTAKTYLSHIITAEQLTGVVTVGTHDWVKFVPPGDMTQYCARPGNNVKQVDLQYVITYPDICQSLATRNFEVNFMLSTCVNTGHYFWAGLKAPKPTASL